ncbi:MAG: phosphotransferase family protein [Acidimicrobiales bacterium]
MNNAPATGAPAADKPGDLVDEPGEVRPEDAFDVAAAHRWISRQVEGISEQGPLPEVRQFPGGASNLTYLLRYSDRDLVLRRPPSGHKAASAHDMGREYRVQKALAGWYRYVPEVLALCGDPSVIGSPFYVMTRVNGLILRKELPPGLDVPPAAAGALARRAVDCLVELHQVDPEEAGLGDLGRGAGYVARQIAGWSDRYRRARTPDVPDFEAVAAWLDRHQPPDVAICLIHNDFRLDNLVLRTERSGPNFRVVGVLDWEMATLGDPMMDLGAVLSYWVQADDDEALRRFKLQPSDLPGMPSRHELATYYCEQTGRSAGTTGDWTFYEVFGLFRLAGIMQQIYFRYHRGETTNPAFKDYAELVGYLDARCRAVAGLAA